MARFEIKPKKDEKANGVELKKDMVVVINTDYSDPLKSSKNLIVNEFKRLYGIDVSKILKSDFFEVEKSN